MTRQEFNPASWTFLTNHSHVLLCLAQNPGIRMREIAERVLITERAVQRIVAELTEAGYISHQKDGRCNRYHINYDRHLRHPIESGKTISELINLLIPDFTEE
ncbi:MAG: MarR family transcriptional regulator [Candidatus Riflebacteria bacterium]|nr:MarR family transcriptional regulator [Candidatus Riflebacteria bacterium]